jgi:uncharacterized protein (UPF0276 family)
MTHVALTYRDPLKYVIQQAASSGLIDAIEVVPSGYAKAGLGPLLAKRLSELGLPYSFHFVDQSLASADFPENNHAQRTRDFLADFSPMFISDHLTAHRIGDLDLETNLPVVCTAGAIDIYTENIRQFVDTVQPRCPMLLEHVPTYYRHAASDLDEATTYVEVVRRSGVDVLLDLHNLVCDEINTGADPFAFIDAVPADRIAEIHVAGGAEIEGTGAYLDTHSEEVPERVFELLDYVCARANPRMVVLEREHRFQDPAQLFADLERIGSIVR